MLEISADREKVNKVRSVVKHEEEITDTETKKVEAIATDAQHDLDNALPQLELATAALDSLSRFFSYFNLANNRIVYSQKNFL